MLLLKRKDSSYSGMFLLLTLSILSSGCTAFRTGYTTQEYAYQMLPASFGKGAERLEMETKINSLVRDYVQKKRFPDYIYVVTQRKFHLIYLRDDLFVTFDRTSVSPKSRTVSEENIPDQMLALVSPSDQQRVLSKRSQYHARPSDRPVAPSVPNVAVVKRNIGTGFAVSPNGLVLTAYHVAEGATKIKVHLSGRGVFDAHVERSSPSTDLVLLRIDAQFSKYLTPISTHSLSIGGRVFTIGYPVINILGEEPKFTEGSIAALSGPAGDATFMQISVPVQPGNSGGPLVTERGELIGVVIGTADVIKFLTSAGSLPQNVSWAVKSDYVRALLPQAGVVNILSREEAIKQTKLCVCLIEAIKEP